MAGAAKYPDSASEWLPYRSLITRLWMDENLPLRKIMEIMETQHGFKATIKMYKSKLSAWGLCKHNKLDDVREILQRRERRKALGKKSIFILRGRPVDMADIERYAKRKGLNVSLEEPTTAKSTQAPYLVCWTPPPTPSPLDAPTSLQNVEHFLQSFNAFVQESLRSGAWSLANEFTGFACIRGPTYPTNARDGFFLSMERGIHRYKWGEMTQAYRQWRLGFSRLPSIVRTQNPSQLLCLLELVARLARCKQEVAALLLRFLGDLVKNEQNFSDTRLSMIRGLSRLETGNLTALVAACYDCCREAFCNRFSSDSFFLLDSETLLTTSGTASAKDAHVANLRLNDCISGHEIDDYKALRSARALMGLLMAAEKHKEAESVALNCLTRMHQMRYDEVVGGAFSHIYGNLVHLYLSEKNYEKAYHNMVMRVENYFDMLVYRRDLLDDFLVGAYSQLEWLTRKLGRDGDADRWNREYHILKPRTDRFAENELSCLEAALSKSLGQPCEPVGFAEHQWLSTPESPLETDIEGSLAAPPCEGHVVDEQKTASRSFPTLQRWGGRVDGRVASLICTMTR
ncbi:uncharacterized protein PV07_11366 [Cladophialophora immunda]|uniref:Clr5 domain-containing protein n=1 Tax=Cladophialophora immunda TaxID=569365 RepID=A0A0D2BVQ0_9EURO|nr:uncharacterized protein PV07_11366 [Cladophialophora immunda]KIW23143.1 hypothetical protein PV07_11366 [Cladophialophora immunda]